MLGLVLTAALASVLLQAARTAVQDEFTLSAEVAVDQLIDEVQRGVAVAEAVRGLVLASEEVSAAEFSTFVAQLRVGERFPAAGGVSVVSVVEPSGVEAFEAATRTLGQDNFAVRPEEPIGDTRWVIRYIEPRETNAEAIGFDIRANPDALEAADRAVRTGEPSMTEPITLVQESADQAGLVVYAPVWRDEQAGLPDAFTSIIFRGTDLLVGTFENEQDLAVTVTDTAGGGPAGGGLVGTTLADDRTPDHTTTLVREVFGREWAIRVDAVQGFDTPIALAVGSVIAGVLLTAALALLLHSLRRREQLATAMAEEATAGLRASEAELADANTRLERSNANLTQSNADLTRFAHVASHDLKEPLRMIGGFLGILETSLRDRLGPTELSETEETSLVHIKRGVSRMQELITDLLELAAVRHVKREEVVDVAGEVERVLEVLQTELDEIDGRVEVGEVAGVVADPRQIRPLVQNLISNAVKFRRPDRPLLVRVSATHDDRSWRLAVADNGIGIEPEHRAEVFEAFTRLHSRDAYDGTGVGLAICQAVVHSYGGSLRIDDGIDGGAMISATIPQDGEPTGGETSGGETSGGGASGGGAE